MAQLDTQVNIAVAEATQRGSELMRGIAAVAMIFLPATFVATFFSMIFFHSYYKQQLKLAIDGRMWWYPAVALPLTAGLTAWYFAWAFSLLAKGVAMVHYLTQWLEKQLKIPAGSQSGAVVVDGLAASEQEVESDDHVKFDDGLREKNWSYLKALAAACSTKAGADNEEPYLPDQVLYRDLELALNHVFLEERSEAKFLPSSTMLNRVNL